MTDKTMKATIRDLEQQNAALKAVVDAWNNVEPVKQEPVAWVGEFAEPTESLRTGTDLYAAPVSVEAIRAQAREERTKELMQLFLDPENQPTQFGTATLEYREKEIAEAVLAEREACAKVCDDKHDYMCSRAAATIRARGEK